MFNVSEVCSESHGARGEPGVGGWGAWCAWVLRTAACSSSSWLPGPVRAEREEVAGKEPWTLQQRRGGHAKRGEAIKGGLRERPEAPDVRAVATYLDLPLNS